MGRAKESRKISAETSGEGATEPSLKPQGNMDFAMKILYMESSPEVLRLGAQHIKHKRSRLGGSLTLGFSESCQTKRSCLGLRIKHNNEKQ